MIPRRIELNASAGADLIHEFRADEITTVDGELVETPVDISTFSAAMEIRRRGGDAIALTLTTDSAGLTLSETEGVLDLRISVVQLAQLLEVSERYWYKVTITSPGGIAAYRIAEGPLNVAAWS